MKRNRMTGHIVVALAFIVMMLSTPKAGAQSPAGAVGISSVVVSFNTPPTSYTVTKAPLRYNKKFALSFHTDDGIADAFTIGFPFFTGIPAAGNDFPGLFYTNGCGTDISYKLSSSVFSFNSNNGPDIHNPGNGYGALSWPQMDSMYRENFSIYNHGLSGDNSSDPEVINYSIKRNESYIRRKLYETTPGGVRTNLFVNPQGNTAWTQPAFDLGYLAALNQSGQGILGNTGGDVNAYTWNQPYTLFRLQAESINLPQLLSQMLALSVNGANYWTTVYTLSLINQYPLADFYSDFNTIAATYGKDGQDNLWMATEEEVIDYLTVRDATIVNYGLIGNNLVIMFDGQIPSDLRFHPLSLVVNANATITNIQINGGTNNSSTGIGQQNALINLEWEGTYIHPIEVLADSFVSIAEQTEAQFDCWVAMDYVQMMPAGDTKNVYRDRLCAIPDVIYEPGFCEDCSFSLGADTTICQGYCVELSAIAGDGYTYLWSNDSTTQSITVCPMETTTYWVEVNTPGGCVSSDTIQILVMPSPVFDFGPDQYVCIGDTVLLEGPPDVEYLYLWYLNGVLTAEDTYQLQLPVTDTVTVLLEVLTPNTCIARDSVTIYPLQLPVVNLGNDINWCTGDSLTFSHPYYEGHSYAWFKNNVFTGVTDTTYTFLVQATSTVRLEITSPDNCTGSDTLTVFGLVTPVFEFGNDLNVCRGDTVRLQAPFNNTFTFAWYLNGVLSNVITNYIDVVVNETVLVKLTVTSPQNCSYSDSIRLIAVAVPGIVVSPQQATLCLGDSLNLSLSATGASSFNWWDGNTSQTRYVTPVKADTTYHYWARAVNSFGCTAFDTAFVRVNPTPLVGLSFTQGSDSVCYGDTIRMLASNLGGGAFDVVVWDHSDTTGVSGLNRMYVPNQNTWVIVEVFTVDGCYGADSLLITVNELPVVSITAPVQEVCQGSPVILTAEGADTYLWSNGLTTAEITVYPMESADYAVIGTNTSGCFATDTISILTFPVTQASMSGLQAVYCLNDAVTMLFGDPEGGLFTGHGIVGSTFSPELAGDGVHTIYYTFENSFGCKSVDSSRTIVFGGNTQIDLGADTLICPDDILTLDAGTGFTQYFWSTGDTTQEITISGADYMPGTSRPVSVVGVLAGCTASGLVNVGIRNDCFINIDEHDGDRWAVVPNPNNGTFLLTAKLSEGPVMVRVYNSQGAVVYAAAFPDCAFDGSPCIIKLPASAQGLYVVSISTNAGLQVHKVIVR
ncbi:MAG: T9SS type A sorting domain-containing protein [Bacteroidales bacterium]|nr:T9SS type A sorting domain-containing protein [Bacteroidales bacterium]